MPFIITANGVNFAKASFGVGISEHFIFAVRELLQPVCPPIFRRLLLLAALGDQGPWQHLLMEQFRGLGLVHLLVLSGSQVQFYAIHLKNLGLTVMPRWWPATLKRWCLAAVLLPGLVLFGQATGWQPPLTRALLMESALLMFPRLRWPVLFVGVIVVQLALFPNHALKMGFYLSWFACWALKVASFARWPYWGRVAFVSCLSQGVACLMLKMAVPGWAQWGLMISSNIAIGCLFEIFLMPLLGGVLAIAGVLTLLPEGGTGAAAEFAGALLRASLESAAAVVLVAIRGFRYIGGA